VTHQDIDEVASAIKARGGTLDHEPADQPGGTRDFSITDPDGFSISISSPMST
jgi:predicted enzyme related to lactoylglutathione lyase